MKREERRTLGKTDMRKEWLFFFSSRRRHTRLVSDWSSDVCSSDLDLPRLVTSMHNGITRIRKIVSSLRTFSRLDEAEQKTIDIHTGLDSALLLLRHRCRAIEHLEDVRIECHYGDLPPVTCYPASLNQVFVNILTNAFDALASVKDRSPKISLATTRLEENCVAIAFRDNGCGIPPEDLPHIFNPFFTTKPPGKGDRKSTRLNSSH